MLIIDTIFFKKYPKFICIIQNKPNLLSNSLLNYFNLKNVFISNFQLLIQISINLNCILLCFACLISRIVNSKSILLFSIFLYWLKISLKYILEGEASHGRLMGCNLMHLRYLWLFPSYLKVGDICGHSEICFGKLCNCCLT